MSRCLQPGRALPATGAFPGPCPLPARRWVPPHGLLEAGPGGSCGAELCPPGNAGCAPGPGYGRAVHAEAELGFMAGSEISQPQLITCYVK